MLALMRGILLIHTVVSTVAAALSRTHYAPDIIPSPWKNLSLATASDSIEFTFVFASDYTPLTQRMEQIASDHSAWLTETELAAYVGPSDTAKSAVQDAIKELSGTVLATSALGDKVTINTTIEKASKVCTSQSLLTTSYRISRTKITDKNRTSDHNISTVFLGDFLSISSGRAGNYP